jgi:hypothetical protein
MKNIIAAGFISIICIQASAQQRHDHRNEYRRGERYNSVPRSVVIPYHNYNYHYADGYFFRPSGAYFSIVAPPIGIYINILPRGYRTVYYPGGICYWYNGAYYRPYNSGYQVIEPPVGVAVPELLIDAKPIVVNNEKLYEMDGVYYKEEISNRGDITYRVVGKQGVVKADNVNTMQVGETIDRLPEGCKTVVLNNQKLFVSPANVYFEEVIKGNAIAYKVVGNQLN